MGCYEGGTVLAVDGESKWEQRLYYYVINCLRYYTSSNMSAAALTHRASIRTPHTLSQRPHSLEHTLTHRAHSRTAYILSHTRSRYADQRVYIYRHPVTDYIISPASASGWL